MSEWRIDDDTIGTQHEGGIPNKEDQGISSETPTLSLVNKLIFVQDFAAAESVLLNITSQYPYDYESIFRLVEVSYKLGHLPTLVGTLDKRSHDLPESVAARLGWTLAEIRLLEQKAADNDNGMEFFTGSAMHENLGKVSDVFGLSATNEMAAVTNAGKLLPSGLHASSLGTLISGKNFRVSRNPDVADDATPTEIPHAQESWADSDRTVISQSADNEPNWSAMPPCIARARQFTLDYPENYAAWFVAGAALEYAGSLSDAVGAWAKAAALQPNSISVLATMTELQQMGVLPSEEINYATNFEALDKFLVHGSLETHMALYHEFMSKHEYTHAIAALRTLGDWLQRQRGDVPAEVETLCLLGAMRAYAESGNASAADACKDEVETIVMSTRQVPRSAAQMKFMGEICQQFGADILARLCFISAIESPDATIEQVVQSTSHSVAVGCSEQTREALDSAYENHHGSSEIRFCQTLCDLAVAEIPIRKYMDRKASVRDLLQTGDLGAAFPLLQESIKELATDPETQYYMGEILSRFGADIQAKDYFQNTLNLDPYNFDSATRFCYFLLKTSDYTRAFSVAEKALRISWIPESSVAELSWAHATSAFALGDMDTANKDIERSLRYNPWNGAYLTLALRLMKPGSDFTTPAFDSLPREIEDAFIANAGTFDQIAAEKWLDHAMNAMIAGYAHYAYTLMRCLMTINAKDERIVEGFIRAAAAFNSRTAAQHLLLSMQFKPELKFNLATISAVIARIYLLDGKWELCEEWSDIAEKSGLEDHVLKAKLLEIQAFGLILEGRNIRKAHGLLEACIDVLESEKRPSQTANALLAFCLSAQGMRKESLERIEVIAHETMNIPELYFAIKIYERANKPDAVKFLVNFAFQRLPTNILDKKLLEEIFQTNGVEAKGMTVSLAS